ncbi:hypothetical protein Trydic_g8891 [Trypoxylus dichotomus]
MSLIPVSRQYLFTYRTCLINEESEDGYYPAAKGLFELLKIWDIEFHHLNSDMLSVHARYNTLYHTSHDLMHTLFDRKLKVVPHVLVWPSCGHPASLYKAKAPIAPDATSLHFSIFTTYTTPNVAAGVEP